MLELKISLSELYLFLILIQNYQALNLMGFEKIIEKYDKLFSTNHGMQWHQQRIGSTHLWNNKEVDSMISAVENLFTLHLTGGNRHEAMKRLRVPPLNEHQPSYSIFIIGLLLGMLLMLVSFLVFTCYVLDNFDGLLFPWTPAFRLYRSLFLICMQVILVGINIYGWGIAGINYVLIFEIDPRKHLTYQRVMRIGVFLTLCLTLSIFVFLMCINFDLYPFMQPLSLYMFSLVYVFNPLQMCKSQSKCSFTKSLMKLITAPMHYVMWNTVGRTCLYVTISLLNLTV
ncbi:hypothetical protein ACOME3_008924 [Neoechinorhynchus agilis]